MKVLVVYDSVFGNTEKIAQAVGAAFGENAQVEKLVRLNIDLYQLVFPTFPPTETPAPTETPVQTEVPPTEVVIPTEPPPPTEVPTEAPTAFP